MYTFQSIQLFPEGSNSHEQLEFSPSSIIAPLPHSELFKGACADASLLYGASSGQQLKLEKLLTYKYVRFVFAVGERSATGAAANKC